MSRAWKNLFLLFIASFVGIIANPEVLTASDSIKIRDLDQLKVVETVMPEPIEEIAEEPIIQIATERTYVTARAIRETEPVVYIPDNYIRIGGKTIEVVGVSSTTVDAGSHVNYIGKLLYGHNSSAVFGGLGNLGIGSTFVMAYGGVTTTYQITRVQMFEKNPETGRLQIDGEGNYMTSVKNTALGHDLALMTCAGEALAGGDATHRLVLFADEI